jgi:hypothetical protein
MSLRQPHDQLTLDSRAFESIPNERRAYESIPD